MKKHFFCFTILVICGTAFAQVPSYVPSNGIVGWYPLDGSVNDQSNHSNHLAIYGDVKYSQNRKNDSNKAITLDGNDDYIASINNFINYSKDFTISVWINFNSFSSSGATVSDRCFFNSYPKANHAIEIWNFMSSQTSNGKNSLGLIGNGSSWFNVPSTEYNLNMQIDSWYNWVISRSNNQRKIYLNGNLIHSYTTVNNSPDQNSGIMFGAMCGGPTWPDWEVNGKLDDIGIWNRALDSNEVKLLYIGCNKSITQQPINQGMYNGNAIFTCATDDSNASFQWQINGGSGWNNLTNVGQYSGANNDTLLVSNVITFNNNQRFRCIVNGSCLTDTTQEATLRVWGLGINGINLPEFNLYPNPSSNSVTIAYSQNQYSIAVYNSLGQMVLSQSALTNEHTFDISQWSKGVYYVELIDAATQTNKVQKLIRN